MGGVLAIVMMVTSAHAGPSSKEGTIECVAVKQKAPPACRTKPCIADSECPDPQIATPGLSGLHGEFPYGCLTDIKACGWKWPVVSGVHPQAISPYSSLGSTDCGGEGGARIPEHPCQTQSCVADADCSDPERITDPSALRLPCRPAYGCLKDVGLCGRKKPLVAPTKPGQYIDCAGLYGCPSQSPECLQPRPCKISDDCLDPAKRDVPLVPGGMASYGCTETHLCGWTPYPHPQKR